ncbi:SDR family oxidoreductase [Streptomyces sp. HUAS MG91]|uniref:SDR family oxidoreductase n=1 Tax=Streptomyces tabacisoli TaxID=3156398 RepID=A0AAU8IJS4_9ACTN
MSTRRPARTPAPDPVAIVGMGLRLPGAADPAALWDLLSHPRDPFSPPGTRYRQSHFLREDRGEPDRTYSPVAGFIHDTPGPEDAPHEVRWLRQCARQATAGVHTRPGDRSVCVVGAWPGGSQSLLHTAMTDLVVREWASVADSAEGTGPDGDELAVRAALATALPQSRPGAPEAADAVHAALRGLLPHDPSVLTVDTACSSSLYALDIGAKILRSGRADMALCGGVSVLEPTMSVLFSAIGGLSATGRLLALDAEADGTLFSDAAVLLTLKRLSRAQTDGDTVLAVLAGFGAAADGRGRSIAAPNPSGQIRAVRRAREERGLGPEDIDWVVAHATGTRAGDAAEIKALEQEAPADGWSCTATKSLVGHAGWASGTASVAHVLLALRHHAIPAQPGFRRSAHPLGRLDIPTTSRVWKARPNRPRTAAVSAFGFGGTNAHLLLSEAVPPQPPVSAPRPAQADPLVLVAWSAHLPGTPSTEAVRAWLNGTGPAPAARFDDTAPPFAAVGLPAPTVRAIDRAQTIALETAHRFAAEHGPLWEPVRERTAVIAAHSGLPSTLVDYALRAHADTLTAALRDHPGATAATRRVLELARDRTPAAGPDAMPGVLPNVIPSRLAARYDLRGASICVDTGRTSAATALDTAAAYVTSGEMDLALVLAVDAGSLHTGPHGTTHAAAQGAFLLALALASTARRHAWPVLTRLTPATELAGSAVDAAPLPSAAESAASAAGEVAAGGFHAAAEAVTLLARLGAAAPSPAPTLTLPPPGAPPARPGPDSAGHLTARHVTRRRPAPWQAAEDPGTVAALPARALVLTDHAPTAARLRGLTRNAEVTLLCTDPDAPPELRPGPLPALYTAVDRADGHVRVVARPHAWPAPPGPAAEALQELLLNALARTRANQTTGSLGAVVVAPAEHPQAAVFTALVPVLRADHPRLPVRVVASGTDDATLAWERLGREWHSADRAVAVWYHDGRRHRHELVPEPLPPAPSAGPLGPDGRGPHVVVASGGAGGVTTALLTALAEAGHAEAVWLLGTTDLDRLPREVLTATDEQIPALRAELIAHHLRTTRPGVAEAARLADRTLAGRRAALNLARLRSVADRTAVHYVVCDITDPDATAAAARQVRTRHDRVDLFLHAATRSRTAPLERKSPADFRLVRAVKITGYHLLREAFAELRPRLWCNIASVAAVHPLRGEIDYGPANAYLAAAADHPDSTGEITLGFPLWSESGYFAAQPDLAARVAAHGRLTGITDAEGVAHFLAEIAPDRGGPAAGVYLGTRERELMREELPGLLAQEEGRATDARRGASAGATVTAAPAEDESPAFLTAAARPGPEGGVRWELDLDGPDHDYLAHHTVRGRPAVPGTFLLAAAAEAALALHPGSTPTRIVDASFNAFVRPSHGRTRHTYTLSARTLPGSGPTTVVVDIHGQMELGDHRPPDRHHFRAHIVLDDPNTVVHRDPAPDDPGLSGRNLPPDPYYFATSPVHLTGPFANTWRWRDTERGPTSLWRPSAESFSRHPLLSRLPVPALLLCAVLRTRTLRPNAAGGHDVVAPRHIDRIDLGDPGSDQHMARIHPQGLTLHHDTDDNSYSAADTEGLVLVHISGFTGAVLPSTPPAGARRQ